MDTFHVYFELITSAGTFILFWLCALRIAHPFECTCGRRFFFARRLLRHLQQAHKYVGP